MLDDFQTISRQFKDKDFVKIYPVYDVHVGSSQFLEKRWLNFIDQVKNEPNSFLIVGGDLMDNGLRNSIANPFEQTMRPADQKIYLAETLKPVADKILCGVSGNHEFRSVKEADENPLYDVFAKLNIEDRFRENGAFLFVSRERKDPRQDRRPVYSLMCMHGSGSAGTIGSGINKQSKFAQTVDGVDIVITGHTHKPAIAPDGKLVIDKNHKTVTQRNIYNVVASSWMQYGGYGMRGQYAPSACVFQEIALDLKNWQICISTKERMI